MAHRTVMETKGATPMDTGVENPKDRKDSIGISSTAISKATSIKNANQDKPITIHRRYTDEERNEQVAEL
ncbi:hypothetical protein [Collinsella sp. AF08-23]|uniref:hypothetical protein n=1 Tax=Collinsella sp. AF08-23 TaxID=2292211 RepID=UPI001314341F|nr:hypothetical protein [Collinsella sp. AF08-23]